jgi:hypothetical protein
MPAMRASTSASQAKGSTPLSFAVVINVTINAPRSAPRSEPARSHDFLPSAKPQADAAIVEESSEAIPALEQIINRFGDGSRAREAGTLLDKPGFQIGQERRALVLPHAQALARWKAVDGALNLEQRVDAFHRFQRDRGDGGRLFAAPGVSGDVSQFEEPAPCMRPT